MAPRAVAAAAEASPLSPAGRPRPDGAPVSPGTRERLLLIAPHASYRTAPFLDAARRLGMDVLIASRGEHSLVQAYAEGLHLDLGNPAAALKAIREAAGRRPFAGVVGTDDETTALAAEAARALGLPHNDPGAVRLARRKDRARARLAEAGLPVPQHWPVDLRRPLAPQIEAVRYPCVVKPVALSASRGVIRADDPRALGAACARVQRLLAGEPEGEGRHRLLIEAFIPGFEIAVEGLLHDGALQVLAIFDKPDPLDGPYFEETYYVSPTRLDAATQARVHEVIDRACRACGLRQGPVHAELRINAEGVWILELAARTIGGLCSRLFRFGTGMDLEEMVLARAMGRPVSAHPAEGGVGVLMIPTPRAGILRRVEGVGAAQRLPHVQEVHIAVREGYELVPLPEGASYLGFIFARAPTAGEAEAALRRAHACLDIVVAPLWKGVAA